MFRVSARITRSPLSTSSPRRLAGGMAAGDPGLHSAAGGESGVRQPGGAPEQHRGQPHAQDTLAGRGPADGPRHDLRHDSQARRVRRGAGRAV